MEVFIMNVYDKAHELAAVLKTIPEVIEYKACKEKIEGNPSNKKMVEDFRKKQIEVYTLQMQGKQPSKEQMESFQGLYSIVKMNPDVNKYLESELRFSQIYSDIMKIMGDAAGVDMTPQV
jgi:cell fate (sporulation/competence/biofilm development) regulator YlbF (YheA/YmcA/DUF963 family)